ncbi:MAG TPA: hypothetical protein VFQ72_02355 [Candidatus Paceibacterota bacterium]|nr:hypothetical protein [Candidatus Paceibacterota bacterium]
MATSRQRNAARRNLKKARAARGNGGRSGGRGRGRNESGGDDDMN